MEDNKNYGHLAHLVQKLAEAKTETDRAVIKAELLENNIRKSKEQWER